MIKFNKHNITDTKNKIIAKVHYSLSTGGDGINRVWIYEKECKRNLLKIFATARNDSDSMTDYFEDTTLRIRADEPYYYEALAQALRHKINVA